ncbi:diguanylate cyclase [Treponema phagedenis]|uniref:phosphoenolpyruvate--glycerone phosphotransferase n=1 Tax=Treponema phagedenis TaxID=162 RepID=A0A0B7GZG5_TREPH|nr:dihydroxyacetone kinase phosphoryl donor subunit DhaM [Treponema phagedenis]EFW36850.1 dihydroxyacetone kinase, phosphotransfer subunit [Treponema phagedenis F0421]NVP24034.1 diguanylate cyclase [Treponema phagedenis]QEJ96180.1 diguanylate cyclase [Treponema phagedenis]QEJ99397.1 diguanylate cyclase [Treponema phagedenis]QEJ99881.1 diguanylate cyclase [Treponema phagedenis]
MVGIVVVSHSKNLADEIITLAREMKQNDFPLLNGSGIDGEHFGSDPMIIKETIEKAYLDGGVIIFVDLGSSILNTEMAIDFIDEAAFDTSKIKIADAPIVEGLIAAVPINDEKATAEDILTEMEDFKNFSKVK